MSVRRETFWSDHLFRPRSPAGIDGHRSIDARGSGGPHVGRHDATLVDDDLIVQGQGAVLHRQIEVTRRVVTATELRVRPHGEQYVAVTRAPVHPDAGQIHRPFAALIEPPADMRNRERARVVIRRDEGLQFIGVRAAVDLDDGAVFDDKKR